MDGAVTAIIKVIDNPVMIFSLVCMGGLLYLLLKREQALIKLYEALNKQAENISDCNVSLGNVIALVEILVYGKGGKRL